MAKLRVIVTATVEYEPDPNYYPKGTTPEKMLEEALEFAKEDTFSFIDTPDTRWEFKGEVVS